MVNSNMNNCKNLNEIIREQKDFFNSGITKDIDFRINHLRKLKEVIKVNEEVLLEALKLDLGKSYTEGFICEIGILYEEINYAIKNIRGWSKAKYHIPNLTSFPSIGIIKREPKGTVLILSPWNYPINLSLIPLVSSIASGNTSIIRLSQKAKNVRVILKRIFDKSFDPSFIYFDTTTDKEEIIKLKYDHIFFTGSTKTAIKIMEAASLNLTPLTMELGGKSPTIVHRDADIKIAGKRIVWGKMMNAGQTCVAPDYLIVHNDVYLPLIEELKKSYNNLYGNNPLNNEELPKIIDESAFNRLESHILNSKVIFGGSFNKNSLKMGLTLIDGYNTTSMNEEIFGPLLPIFTYKNEEEIIDIIKNNPNPLALYIFSNNKAFIRYITENTAFGGLTINDTLLHLSDLKLPFGGTSTSGMGQYHGEYGFNELTRIVPKLKRFNILDFSFRYPPYGSKLKLLKRLFK